MDDDIITLVARRDALNHFVDVAAFEGNYDEARSLLSQLKDTDKQIENR